MMNDRTSRIIVGLILFKLTLVIGSCVGASSVESSWKLEAAATHIMALLAAQYKQATSRSLSGSRTRLSRYSTEEKTGNVRKT